MASGWRYRGMSVLGTALLTTMAVTVANVPVIQEVFSRVPYFGRPAPAVLSSGELLFTLSTTLVVVLASMWPLFKPRPRRILDTVFLTQKRVLLAMVGLAALGYFNYTYRLPRSTLMLSTTGLLALLPLFAILIRRKPRSSSRAIIVGDDPEMIRTVLQTEKRPILGSVTSPTVHTAIRSENNPVKSDTARTELDALSHLGGFSRLDEVLAKHDVDTALLAFHATDREEFFGTLEVCYEHGIKTLVHRNHADHILSSDPSGNELLEVDLEPWDWQDYILKRAFDIVFALTTLLVLTPLIIGIAAIIKLDSPGPVLYSQKRTAEFGSTFTIYKFRSMRPGDEETVPSDDAENSRITRIGRVLRRTHLDEIPQLWSILTGEMSVLRPRATWTNEEIHLESVALSWRKRWFVKPGLTGLAQINHATSTDPEVKLRYDIQYIRRQSFWFDSKILIRQLWEVGADAIDYVWLSNTQEYEKDTPEETSEKPRVATSDNINSEENSELDFSEGTATGDASKTATTDITSDGK